MDINKIEWKKFLSADDLPVATDEDISNAEVKLGHFLPDDYKQALKKYQFLVPYDLAVKVGDTEEPVSCLFHIYDDGSFPLYSVLSAREDFLDLGIDTLIPFSDNSADSYFAFDYSNSDAPSVVFINNDFEPGHRYYKQYIASSFTDFIEKAYIS